MKGFIWRDLSKAAVRPFSKLICLTLGLVLGLQDHKIVFLSRPDATDNSWHLYRYMVKRLENKHFVWLCEKPLLVKDKITEVEGAAANRITVVKQQTLSSLIQFACCKYVFLSHGLPSFLPVIARQTIVNLWHGMPIKSIGFLNPTQSPRFVPYSHVLSTSEFFKDILSDAFDVPERRIIQTGLPRNDALLNSREDTRRELAAAIGIPAAVSTLFWLPTFRNSHMRKMASDASTNSFVDEWSSDFWPRLSEAAVETGRVLVIKLHPSDILNVQETALARYPGIRVISRSEWSRIGIDLYDALATSSGLISDLSSVLIDYAVTGNPIAVTCGSRDQYSRGIIEGTESIMAACYQIESEDAFIDFVLDPLSGANRLSELAFYNRQAGDRQEACRAVVKSVGI